MLAKPRACIGCPFYGDGRGFVPDLIREGAKVMVVGQNPGEQEEAQGQPFVGKTGQEMEKYLRDAGLTRDDVSIANTFRCRYNHTNDLPPVERSITKEAMRHCTEAYFKVPSGTRLMIAQGDYAAVMLTGEKVGDWRGYLRPWVGSLALSHSEPWVPSPGDVAVLLTVHLAYLFRQPSLTLPTHLDWAKVGRILEYTWPRRPPRMRLHPLIKWPAVFAFDTEFTPQNHLVRYSLAWGTGDRETVVVEAGDHEVPAIQGRPQVITQYAPADVRHLTALSRSKDVWEDFLIEDTVWKHAVLWSDFPHDLNFLASLYGSFNRHKHLADTDPILYSGLDATVLWEVDTALNKELDADPRSRMVWETVDRPALGHFVRAQYRGLRVNPQRVQQVVGLLEREVGGAQRKAVACSGWPINVGSNQHVAHRLFQVEGIKPPRGRI